MHSLKVIDLILYLVEGKLNSLSLWIKHLNKPMFFICDPNEMNSLIKNDENFVLYIFVVPIIEGSNVWK